MHDHVQNNSSRPAVSAVLKQTALTPNLIYKLVASSDVYRFKESYMGFTTEQGSLVES